MKTYLNRLFVFTSIYVIVIIISAVILSKKVENRDFENHETESNLLIIEPNTKYDLAFLGISHARNFSRYSNHQRVESILKKKILNLGKGNATCGINELHFYLKYCYKKNVHIDTLLYFITPPLIYSDYLNRASNTFNDEPLRFDFLIPYLFYKSENKWERIFYYFRSKFKKEWINLKPYSLNKMTEKLEKIDSIKVEKGLEMAYLDGLQLEIFNKNFTKLEETIDLANRNNTSIIFIITPTLFGKWDGQDLIIKKMDKLQSRYNFKYFDFSKSMFEPKYYYDHHHLNTNGILYFSQNFLIPIFKK